ncbi:MAG TPA: DNA repair protein RadC [Geminicoccaceae bacterium]
MTEPLAGPGIDAYVAALHRAGLELREHSEEGNGAEFLLQGNTYANKELLKRHGGRWSRSRQGWVFESLEPIRDLATALPADGEAHSVGLADAPAHYGADRATRRFRRKHYHGHRERLRTRFLEAGPHSLPDYELLELLLFHSIEVKDTKPLAKGLLARFGNLGGVISADPRLFAEFDELRENTDKAARYHAFRSSEEYQLARDTAPEARSDEARRWLAYEESDEGRREIDLYWARRHTEILLKAIGELLKRVLREEIRDRPVIGSWTALIDYLQVALAHEPIEQFRVLFLDRKNILIRDELQQRGTVDHTPLYPREIVKRALELGASAIIMVHNHPSGDPTPSRADIEMTKQVVQAMSAVGLTVHDHVIVGKNRHTSFKSQRLI